MTQLEQAMALLRKINAYCEANDSTLAPVYYCGFQKELAAFLSTSQHGGADLRAIIERDRTLFAECVERMNRKIANCHWMVDSRGSYEWDDKRYQDEFGSALEMLRAELAVIARRAGDMSNSPKTQAEVNAARIAAERKCTEGG